MITLNYGWKGTIREFLQLSLHDFVQTLTSYVYGSLSSQQWHEEQEKIQSQQKAWKDCFEKLQQIFHNYNTLDGWLIFEYSILRGSGRRPDVLLLLPGHVLVIECKSYNAVSASEYLQTSLYVRDIEHYHSTVQKHSLKVTGVLLLTNHSSGTLLPKNEFQVYLASQNSLCKLINGLIKRSTNNTISADQFLEGTYQPSPSMLEAARAILNNKDLPRIKAVDSSNFDDVYNTIQSVIEEAQQTNTHHLILVSGEPGAGKTFLGLKIAHATPNSIYLSGNGPLVEVLQDTLNNKTFVQSLYSYKRDYLQHGKTPHEQIIIFDEAQRAWDAQKMNSHLSEPDVIIQIAKANKPWSVVIGLIGDGQEIHLGEESGLSLWNTAIQNQGITVHAKHENLLFENAERYEQHEHLHLNCSLRSHAALKYYAFVNALLDDDIENAQLLKQPLEQQRYPIFVTNDLQRAKEQLRNLYTGDNKTFGILCASGADHSKHIPVVPFGGRNMLPKPATAYFNYPNSDYYCKELRYAATEFQTQGLELDTAIVHWDEDLYWHNGQWQCNYTKTGAKNPQQMKINAYRVLLTRGRDATIIYVPNKPILKGTWDLFIHELKIPVL
ncbi:DNA/RNA helicase domain-containing protein [Lysinibacillus sp. NPDC093190]|uniref:DNA/RNA helicase domain-containing protein n=1 Tax=Lysinibacillus sp. NPDC093190 TaxID=3390575 RepID=UPI003D04A8AD